MDYICKVCNGVAEVFCSCDTSDQYCYRDFVRVHQKTKGEHNEIDLVSRREEISQKFISTMNNLKKVKKKIISRSNELIQIIKVITKSKLSSIDSYIDCCNNIFKSRELDTEKMFKDYQNIETREANLESFVQITTQKLAIFKDNQEITDIGLKKVLIEIKLKSLKLSKKVQKKVQSTLNNFLKGYVLFVYSVAVTSDNKYIVSGSDDNTIRI